MKRFDNIITSSPSLRPSTGCSRKSLRQLLSNNSRYVRNTNTEGMRFFTHLVVYGAFCDEFMGKLACSIECKCVHSLKLSSLNNKLSKSISSSLGVCHIYKSFRGTRTVENNFYSLLHCVSYFYT